LPQHIDIVNTEVLSYYLSHPELNESTDVVVANPPFVRLEDLTAELRLRVTEVLGDLVVGLCTGIERRPPV